MMRACFRLLLTGSFLLAASVAFAAPVRVQVDVAERGTVVLELYPDRAPKTVAHFVKLVRTGFYNGILVHRVVPSFVVQFGDPKTRSMKPHDLAGKSEREVAEMGLGAGGSGSSVPFEDNNLTHETGTLSLALSAEHSATGDSQVFINLKPNHMLDGGYCVFGKVVRGMDVVRKMCVGDRVAKASVVAAPKPKAAKASAKPGALKTAQKSKAGVAKAKVKVKAPGSHLATKGKPEKLGSD